MSYDELVFYIGALIGFVQAILIFYVLHAATVSREEPEELVLVKKGVKTEQKESEKQEEQIEASVLDDLDDINGFLGHLRSGSFQIQRVNNAIRLGPKQTMRLSEDNAIIFDKPRSLVTFEPPSSGSPSSEMPLAAPLAYNHLSNDAYKLKHIVRCVLCTKEEQDDLNGCPSLQIHFADERKLDLVVQSEDDAHYLVRGFSTLAKRLEKDPEHLDEYNQENNNSSPLKVVGDIAYSIAYLPGSLHTYTYTYIHTLTRSLTHLRTRSLTHTCSNASRRINLRRPAWLFISA